MKVLLSLLILLLTAFAEPSAEPQLEPDVPLFQQFCSSQGWGNCFAIDGIDINEDAGTVTVGNRAPLSISAFDKSPILILGDGGVEYSFETEWGNGVLIQTNDDDAFTGEIELENSVLHIYRCAIRYECSSYGYILEDEIVDFHHLEPAEPEKMDDNVSRRLRRLLKATSESTNPNTKKPRNPRVHPETAKGLRRHLFVQGGKDGLDCGTLPWWAGGQRYCVVTVNFAFPKRPSCSDQARGRQRLPGRYPQTCYFNEQAYKQLCKDNAAIIVAEFNEAMRWSTSSWTGQHAARSGRTGKDHNLYMMSLNHIDYTTWDLSQRAIEMCVAYRQSRVQDADLTQCVVQHHPFADRMAAGGGGADINHIKGGVPATWLGVSWLTEWGLPSGYWGKYHIGAHEFGHNFGGVHRPAYDTLMGFQNPKRVRYEAQNAIEIRRNFEEMAHHV